MFFEIRGLGIQRDLHMGPPTHDDDNGYQINISIRHATAGWKG